jgi:hypothetical protein
MSEAKYKTDVEAANRSSANNEQSKLSDMGGLPNPKYQALGWASLMFAIIGLVLGVTALVLVLDVRGRL